MLHLLKARDGRTLDVLLAGDDDSSFGLVCHHGTPSDATIWSDWHEDALSNNLRLVAISDLYLTCPECNGSRYNQAALEIRFEGKTVAEILALTVTEGLAFFKQGAAASSRRAATREAGLKFKILTALKPLEDLGLGYLRLGQPLNTLSGGEAQRLKLCTILTETRRKTAPSASPPAPRSSLLILDEPTTGLHFGDIEKLLAVLDRKSVV